MKRLGALVRRVIGIPTVVLFALIAVGQSRPDKRKVVFEHGRWEIISCSLGGKDCPNGQISNSTGPVSTSHSIEKKIDEIQCYKQQGLCIVASAGNANEFVYADIERFFVARWDERGIEANWTYSNGNDGEWEQRLSIAFADSGVDSVIIDDSLIRVPKDRIAKDHLLRYQLVHDSQWHHF
jgi:hypothetical protein